MRKILLQLFALMLLFGTTGCFGKKTTDDSLNRLKQKGVLIIGLDDSFPPMGFRDENNEITGFDIDLAKETAARLGVTFKAQPIEWGNKDDELFLGKIDCIWNGLTITEQRENSFAITKPYINNDQVLVVHKNSGIHTFADMNGQSVGCQIGSTAEQAINRSERLKKSLKEIKLYQNNINALEDLESKTIDAVVMDSIVAAYNINKYNKPFIILEEILQNESYGVAFRKNEIKLRDEVEKILEQMGKDGTTKAISQKWFGADITVIGK